MNRGNFTPPVHNMSNPQRFPASSPDGMNFYGGRNSMSPGYKHNPHGFNNGRPRFSPGNQFYPQQRNSPNNSFYSSPPNVYRSPYNNGQNGPRSVTPNRFHTPSNPRYNQSANSSFGRSYSKNSPFDRSNCNPGGSNNIEHYYKSDMTSDPWEYVTPVPASK